MQKFKAVKFTRTFSKPFITSIMCLALVIGISLSAAGKAEPSPPLTKQQVKALIKTAKTPEDHLKLARYFRYEAARLTAEAKDHQ